MTTHRNNFHGQTGAATAAGSAASGDAYTSQTVIGAGTLAYQTGVSFLGRSGVIPLRAVPASASTAFFDDQSFSGLHLWADDGFNVSGTPTVDNTVICDMRDTSNLSHGQLVLTNTGKLAMVVVGGTRPSTGISTAALAAGRYRYSFDIFSDTTAGTGAWSLYNSSGTLIESKSFTAQNTRGGLMQNIRRACTSNSFAGSLSFWEYMLIQGSDTAAPGLFPTNLAPTANAGVDQVDLEPWSTATLSGVGSSDPDGTIASYLWRQVSGTAVTLSSLTVASPTFVVPAASAGGTLQFGLKVTDDLGLQSTEDFVNVAYLEATEFYLSGGVWRPMQIQGL